MSESDRQLVIQMISRVEECVQTGILSKTEGKELIMPLLDALRVTVGIPVQ